MGDYEMEISRTIWDNKHGTTVVVKPDGDGLGLVDIVQSETRNRITISPEEARLVADALCACADEIEDTAVGASA